MLPQMNMAQIGFVADVHSRTDLTTVAVHMERLKDLASWSAEASPAEHAYAMRRVLFLMIQATHEGVICGDSKAANCAIDLHAATGEIKPLVFMDLGGVYFKEVGRLGRKEFRGIVRLSGQLPRCTPSCGGEV